MISTNLEQSKKLLELGIDITSADMHYHYDLDFDELESIPTITEEEPKEHFLLFPKDIPAWNLSALLGLMPFQIIENNQRFGFYQVKGFNKQGETYRFGYKTNNDSFFL